LDWKSQNSRDPQGFDWKLFSQAAVAFAVEVAYSSWVDFASVIVFSGVGSLVVATQAAVLTVFWKLDEAEVFGRKMFEIIAADPVAVVAADNLDWNRFQFATLFETDFDADF